jgi:hypothetical protein
MRDPRLIKELSPNLGDGRGQAAARAFDLTTSIPSANLTPRMSFGNWLWPSERRQLLSAAFASLKMASAVSLEIHPLARTVLWRMVANKLSMTSVVRRCFQCPAGKVRLAGPANDFSIVDHVTKALRAAGIPKSEIDKFCDGASASGES